MNRLFTSIAVMLLGVMASQAAVSVSVGGVAVANGGTVTMYKDKFSYIAPLKRWTGELKLAVLCTGPVSIEVASDSDALQFCPEGEQCYTLLADGGVFKGSGTVKSNSFGVDVHRVFMPFDALPVVNETMAVAMTDASGDKFSFTIAVNTETNGIADVATGEHVSFSGNMLKYVLDTPTLLEVFSITGNRVMSQLLDASGAVDLSGLASGIYIYRLGNRTARVRIR